MIMMYFWVCCEGDGLRYALDSLQFHCVESESRKMALLIKLVYVDRMSVVMGVGKPVIGGACEVKQRVPVHSGGDGIHNIWLCL